MGSPKILVMRGAGLTSGHIREGWVSVISGPPLMTTKSRMRRRILPPLPKVFLSLQGSAGGEWLSIAGIVGFLVLAGKGLFSIPRIGAIAGVLVLFLLFLLWYFVLCRDVFKGRATGAFNTFAPISFVLIFFAIIVAGLFRIIPWWP